MKHQYDEGRGLGRRGWLRLIALGGAVAAFLVLLAIAFPGESKAAGLRDGGFPGVDICAKNPPIPALPTEGLPGLLGERPVHVTNDDDPAHIWSTGGFAGLQVHPYDLGCALDPSSWTKIMNANTDATLSNGVGGGGQVLTSLSDSMDRRAWQPGYVLSFLSSFAERASQVANLRIVGPLLGAGLIAAAILVAWRNSKTGNMKAAASSFGWVLFVVTVSAGLIAAPLLITDSATKVGSFATGVLNGSAAASDGATNSIVESVHYQGWLRRTFGSGETEAADVYGMKLLDSQRITWTEYDKAQALKGDARKEYVEKLLKRKNDEYKDVAAKIKDQYPMAYKVLTVENSQGGVSFVEVAFSIAANAFRIACDLLVIVCLLIVCLLGVLWLALTPWIVTPWGEAFGRSEITNVVRAMKYVCEAALASWGFTIYLQAALAPGMTIWWSLLLLIVGAGIAWLLLAPFKKITALLTLGRVKGHSFFATMLKTALLGAVAGKIGGKAAAKVIEEEKPKASEDAPAPVPTPAPAPVHSIYTPDAVFDPQTRTHFTPNPGAGLPPAATGALPSGAPVYQRTADDMPPVPPPNATTAPEEGFQPYQRADNDDNEGADR